MPKYKVTTTREDQYEIEIDPKVWTKEKRDVFASVFWSLETLEEMADKISVTLMMQGTGQFYEGWGYLKAFYPNGMEIAQGKWENGTYTPLTPSDFTEGIVIKIIDEEYYESEVEEIIQSPTK